MLKTSLAQIESLRPCAEGWKKIRKGWKEIRKGAPLTARLTRFSEFPVSHALQSNSIEDVLWLTARIAPEVNSKFTNKCALMCLEELRNYLPEPEYEELHNLLTGPRKPYVSCELHTIIGLIDNKEDLPEKVLHAVRTVQEAMLLNTLPTLNMLEACSIDAYTCLKQYLAKPIKAKINRLEITAESIDTSEIHQYLRNLLDYYGEIDYAS